jgi:hypothetical protein
MDVGMNVGEFGWMLGSLDRCWGVWRDVGSLDARYGVGMDVWTDVGELGWMFGLMLGGWDGELLTFVV